MGCNNSAVANEKSIQVIDDQIQQLKDGTMPPISLKIFLENFKFVINYQNFYTQLPLEKQLFVFENIGPLPKKECSLIIQNICQNAESEEVLLPALLQVSRKLVCETKIKETGKNVYIPIGLDSGLFKAIMQKSFKTKYGKIKITKNTVDFNSSDITRDRQIFLDQKQNEVHEVQHTEEMSLLIQSNKIENLWMKDANINVTPFSPQKPLKTPKFWEKNIHTAAFTGKISSVKYNIYLIPELLNLLDERNNTPAHYAARGNQLNVLKFLHEAGADFTILNDIGQLAFHLITNQRVMKGLSEAGMDINERNAKGESLLDVKTQYFDLASIQTMLKMGVDIFEQNEDGSFWMQKTMHKKYYGNMKEEKFVNTIRKEVMNNKKASWNSNPIYKEVIARKGKTQPQQDREDLNESALKPDIPRVKVLLALGTKPDEVLPTGETTLYLCSKRGIIDSVKILLQNYCDPNFTNSQKENTFWVATVNEHFDVALLLRDYGANMDIVAASGETLLHNVYRRKIQKLTDFVLETGASPNVKNNKCQTVTYEAFLTRDDKFAELLQDKYKGDINAQDHLFFSLAHHALEKGDLDRIDYLHKRGINMELQNNKGFSVMLMAFNMNTNFELWEFLLAHGSNINTVDYQKNSMLHHFLFNQKPSQDVFDFLISHGIDINLENHAGQFPISIAIEKMHDTFGYKLLEMDCKLLNPTSIHEPIAEALKRKDQKWFETLVDHKADGMNEKYGVVSHYITSGFFKYDYFKKLPKVNLLVEAPIQVALLNKENNCAMDLWQMAGSKEMEKRLSSNKDDKGRIPLTAAIIMKNEQFFKIFCNKDLDCQTADKEGKTPFMHACIINNKEYIQEIFKIIPLKNADCLDKDKCSALTYLAENNNRELCDYLFINDIDIDKPKLDKNGIIKKYRDIMDSFNAQKEKAYKDYREAKEHLQVVQYSIEQKTKEINSYIGGMNQIADHTNSFGAIFDSADTTMNNYDKYKSNEQKVKELKRELKQEERKLGPAERQYQKYKTIYDRYKNATREDILYHRI